MTDLVGSAPVVVADGRHRLATAIAYREGAGAGTPGADGILALVVELSPRTHRRSDPPPPLRTARRTRPRGRLRLVVRRARPATAPSGPPGARRSSALALITPEGCWMLTPRDGTPEAAGSDLDSSMVAMVLAELPDHELTFAHSWQEAVAAVADGEAQAAVLLTPVSVAQIDAWARARRRMPPKSTYFHPKPRTGTVFRALDPD